MWSLKRWSFFEKVLPLESLLQCPICSSNDHIIDRFPSIFWRSKWPSQKLRIHFVQIHNGNEFLSNKLPFPWFLSFSLRSLEKCWYRHQTFLRKKLTNDRLLLLESQFSKEFSSSEHVSWFSSIHRLCQRWSVERDFFQPTTSQTLLLQGLSKPTLRLRLPNLGATQVRFLKRNRNGSLLRSNPGGAATKGWTWWRNGVLSRGRFESNFCTFVWLRWSCTRRYLTWGFSW